MGRDLIKYSENFKQKIVEEIETRGKSIPETQRKYGITGSGTIYRWIRQRGKNSLVGKVVRVETVDEKNVLKFKDKEIADLQKALARSELKVMKLEVDLEWIEEKHGISVKKKNGGSGQKG